MTMNMENKQILIETHVFSPRKTSHNIMEGSEGKGNLIVEGILSTCEVKNGNGRYYPRELWEREMGEYADSIKEGRATGELDHPESQVINLKNVSHRITETWWEGDHVMGKIEILPTPSGNILKALIESGVKVGVSSRGMGSLEENEGVLEVQDDFKLLCWDFVSTPSNPGSYTSPLHEGLNNPQFKSYKKVNNILTDILCSQGSCYI